MQTKSKALPTIFLPTPYGRPGMRPGTCINPMAACWLLFFSDFATRMIDLRRGQAARSDQFTTFLKKVYNSCLARRGLPLESGNSSLNPLFVVNQRSVPASNRESGRKRNAGPNLKIREPLPRFLRIR
jgi:hypothetical protein